VPATEPASPPQSTQRPFVSSMQVSATAVTLMEAHPTAGVSLLASWTARILELGKHTEEQDLELVRGIVAGLVHGERLAASRQLRLAQIAVQNDPLSMACGAFHVLCADVTARLSRSLNQMDAADHGWQPPQLSAIDLPILVDDD